MSYLHPVAAKLWAARGKVQEATLTGTVSLVTRTANPVNGELEVYTGVLELAPDGSNRTVLLPTPGKTLEGAELVIKHGDGANDLAVESASGTTLVTVSTAEATTVRCVNDPTSGYTWYNVGLHKAT